MQHNQNFLDITPVLPSLEIKRDVDWYEKKTGFNCIFSDNMYAILVRENQCIHLQWHANTADDPLLGGSVIRIFVRDVEPLLKEFIERGIVTKEKYNANTPWNTKEFGFYDLNKNAIFIVQDLH